jgi:type I restriction enzyme S subunit
MIRVLFKSWFVDFAPVRAKAEGRDPGLTSRHTDFFSDSLDDSELGEIPATWRIMSLGEMSSRVAMGPFGSNIKTDNFVEIGVPVIRGGNLVDGFIDERFVYLTDEKADELRNSNAFPGDIVITHRGTLGQVGLIPRLPRYPRYVISQSQMLISADASITTPLFLFEFLRSKNGQHQLLANTSQTGVPAIARPTTSLKAIRTVVPPLTILEAFEELAGPLVDRIHSNQWESRALHALRDTLLPKLISGELRVPGS